MAQDEFRINSGRLSLDLPATVRRRASEPNDVLAPPGAPARWLFDLGLSSSVLTLSDPQLVMLVELREAIWRAAAASVAQRPLPAEAVNLVNKAAAHPLSVPQLDAATASVRNQAHDPFLTALAAVARDAVDLLGSPARYRIKACAQPDCQMLFLDASRSGRRRWCSMDRCGSRAKGDAFRKRQKGER